MEPKNYFFAASFWTLAIAIVCLVSTSSIPSVSIPGKDKMVHGLFYFVFSILWFVFLSKRFPLKSFGQKAISVFVMTLVYGGLVELMQDFFTTTRKADLLDVLANLSGSIVAIFVLRIVTIRTK
ncbi:VanZ family protein [Flavobacterium sp.]|uniref:VanZ family protein n=1 Tax=Flavobacterium sp. TaxID=239 RepID=UPI0028BD53FE|nr:VanZ family protein [Flavobacterium sp.]